MPHQTKKTYSGGSDASVGLGISDGKSENYKTQISIASEIASKLDDWFGDPSNIKCDEIIGQLNGYKDDLEACGADEEIIGACSDAIDDLGGTAALDLARIPLDQMVSKLLYPPEIETHPATVKTPDEDDSSIARYIPEDVVFVPSIMKLGIIKSYVKNGNDYIYDVELINADRLPIGKAICEETTLEPRSKSAMKHAAMKLSNSMDIFCGKLSNLVDAIGSDSQVPIESIDNAIGLANELLQDKTLDKKFFRAMQTSQYALGSAKRILEQTGDENAFNDAILQAYSYANKVKDQLASEGTNDFQKAGLSALKTLIKMFSIHEPDSSAIGRIITELSPFSKSSDTSIKSASTLTIAISGLKRARKFVALGQNNKALAELSTSIKAIKILTDR